MSRTTGGLVAAGLAVLGIQTAAQAQTTDTAQAPADTVGTAPPAPVFPASTNPVPLAPASAVVQQAPTVPLATPHATQQSERELLPQLWVRVAATMLRAGWSRTVLDYEMPNGGSMSSDEARRVSLRFAFEPSISLRLSF